ncbi:unnamed protein product [Rodentolepis nana]|uniref:Protein DPCD n=1 Tax=Rodentolepis nana TaxID=102285 RepID=A0A0R3TXT2_RODNA|nr:unnamed protein product [Rodentolepis nana]
MRFLYGNDRVVKSNQGSKKDNFGPRCTCFMYPVFYSAFNSLLIFLMNNDFHVNHLKAIPILYLGRTKVHYNFPDGKEMTEQYDNNSGIIIERKWKRVPMVGGEGIWTYEIGQEPEKPGSVIRESAANPIFCRADTKQSFQWRIRNLPYPIDTYQLSIEDDSVIVLRTTNKK